MRIIWFLMLIAAGLSTAVGADGYRLDWLSISAGGGIEQSSANYGASLIVAQAVAGNCESANHHAYFGFWCPTLGNIASIEETPSLNLPTSYSLRQNYPNPFNPTTAIEFSLPHSGNVHVAVYNLLGQLVAILVDEQLTAGSYRTIWDGRNLRGNEAASGIYFYRLKTSDFVMTKKMVLLK